MYACTLYKVIEIFTEKEIVLTESSSSSSLCYVFILCKLMLIYNTIQNTRVPLSIHELEKNVVTKKDTNATLTLLNCHNLEDF